MRELRDIAGTNDLMLSYRWVRRRARGAWAVLLAVCVSMSVLVSVPAAGAAPAPAGVGRVTTDDVPGPGTPAADVGILAEPKRTPPAEPSGEDVEDCLASDEAHSEAGRVYNRFMWCQRWHHHAVRGVAGRVVATMEMDYSIVGYGRDDQQRSVVIFFRGDDVDYWPTPKGQIRPTSYIEQGISCPENQCDDTDWERKQIKDWVGSWTRFEVTSDPAFGSGPDQVSHAPWFFTGTLNDPDWGYQLTMANSARHNIRCDSAAYFPGREGACVFNDVIPRFELSTRDPLVDEVSEHIRCAQAEPNCYRDGARHNTYPYFDGKTIPGEYVSGEPRAGALHRISPEEAEANRKVVQSTCGKAPTSVYDPAAGEQCDEYPMASTAEGAAHGAEDYSVEGVSADDNECAGTALQHYYRKDRILRSYRAQTGTFIHQDDFFVHVGEKDEVVTATCEPLLGLSPGGCGSTAAGASDDVGVLCFPRPPHPDDPPPPVNQPPHVDAGPDRTTPEGTPVGLTGTVTDPEDDPAVSWSYGQGEQFDPGAACALGTPGSTATTFVCDDDGDAVVALTADDGHNPPVTDPAFVQVTNVAPSSGITAPAAGELVNARVPAPVTVAFTDPGANDTHSCAVDFGDGTPAVPGTVSQERGRGTCTASHTYGFDGLGPRTITTTVTDDDGGADVRSVDVVVFVPGAGHALSADGTIDVGRTPDVRCPPDDEQAAASLGTPVADLRALAVSCSVNTTSGRTEVHSEVGDVALLGGLVRIEDIVSTCTADAAGIVRTSAVGTINGIPIGTGTGSLSVLGLVEIHYNEQTIDPEGRLVQNAIRAVALGQEITVSSCRLG
ncbi:NucA/NucB deoxyribonuclease domain-containing protein [Myceligenerans crystallogenes]|uniref:Deoxyribonuclease NucA/NucB domain-containing protein n=1 Tax=Myceligenerans crystallogenes TaxID=316335 RepID=A0ABN2NFS6_9MICO